MATKLRKKFRVASSGATIDGRQIKPEWLKQAAANYNPDEYAARINVDHGKWASYGDVIAFEAREEAGRVDLYADIELNAYGKYVNEAGQKVFSSIELHDSVPGMNGMYVTGLAMTDQPASMRTERLSFSAFSRNKATQAFDTEWTAEEIAAFADDGDGDADDKAKATATWTDTLRKYVADKFAAMGKGHDKADAALQAGVQSIVTELADQFADRIQAADQRADELAAKLASLGDQLAAQTAEFQQLKSGTQPATGYTQRPTSSGGKGLQLAEF